MSHDQRNQTIDRIIAKSMNGTAGIPVGTLPMPRTGQVGRLEFLERHARFVDIGKGLRAAVMTITPAMAADWLTRLLDNQRNRRAHQVLCIAEDIKHDRWYLNGETFIFSDKGRMIQGQHRCSSIVIAEKAIQSVVVTGVDEAAFVSIDNTSRRSGADALKVNGVQNCGAVSAAAVLLRRYQEHGSIYATRNISPTEIADIVATNPSLEASAVAAYPAFRICRSNSIPTFAHFVFSELNRDKADEFMALLASGDGLLKANPIWTLRDRLIKAATKQVHISNIDMTIMLFRTWNACRAGKAMPASHLRISANDRIPKAI